MKYIYDITVVPMLLWAGGSTISQLIEQRSEIKKLGFKQGFVLDKQRFVFDTIWGTIFGSQLNLFTRFMTTQIPGHVIKRTMTSWFIISPILNAEYLVVRSLMRAHGRQKKLENGEVEPTERRQRMASNKFCVNEMMQRKFPGVLIKSACVWPAAFFSNYKWIPTSLSPLFMNTVAVTWSAIMSK